MTTLPRLDPAFTVELAEGNYLRPNGHGGYLLSYSQLSSWARCQLQKYYEDRAKHDPEAPQPAVLSQTSYGTVVHYALMIGEQAKREGREDYVDLAVRTFVYYWNPENIEAVAPRVTEWLPRQTYAGLRDRGKQVIRTTLALLAKDDAHLLAVEYEFHVPIVVRGRTHTLRGMIDRLSVKKARGGVPYLCLDDYKTGKQPTYLRYNLQGSAYAYVSTLPEFWTGWDASGLGELETFDVDTIERVDSMFASWGVALHSGTHWESAVAHDESDVSSQDVALDGRPLASRQFRWINLQDFKFADGGWRGPQDYARLHMAVDAYVRSCEAEVYSPTATGEICRYCSFRDSCGGIGLPHESAGAP